MPTRSSNSRSTWRALRPSCAGEIADLHEPLASGRDRHRRGRRACDSRRRGLLTSSAADSAAIIVFAALPSRDVVAQPSRERAVQVPQIDDRVGHAALRDAEQRVRRVRPKVCADDARVPARQELDGARELAGKEHAVLDARRGRRRRTARTDRRRGR